MSLPGAGSTVSGLVYLARTQLTIHQYTAAGLTSDTGSRSTLELCTVDLCMLIIAILVNMGLMSHSQVCTA